MPAIPRLPLILSGLLAALCAGAVQAEPSWWRVSDGHSEVWILGAPRIAPRDLAWDTAATERRLGGVNTLIVGPRARKSLKAAGLLFSSLSSQPLESTLPAPLKQRFVAVRESLGKPASHYANWKPAAASKALLDDFYGENSLQQGGIETKVIKLAHAKGVHDVPAGEFSLDPAIDQLEALSPANQLVCLDASVHDVERGAAVVRNVAADWAKGEVNDQPIDPIDRTCVAAIPAIDAQAARTLVEEADAVAQALTTPGHAMAVFELHNMTEPGGVADRLRAKGLQVTGPTH